MNSYHPYLVTYADTMKRRYILARFNNLHDALVSCSRLRGLGYSPVMKRIPS